MRVPRIQRQQSFEEQIAKLLAPGNVTEEAVELLLYLDQCAGQAVERAEAQVTLEVIRAGYVGRVTIGVPGPTLFLTPDGQRYVEKLKRRRASSPV